MKLPRWTELEISYFSEELVYFPALHNRLSCPVFYMAYCCHFYR